MLAELTDEQFAQLVERVRPPAEHTPPDAQESKQATPKAEPPSNAYPAAWGYQGKGGK